MRRRYQRQFAIWMGVITLLAVILVAVYAPLRRLPLVGGIIGYLVYLLFANGFGLGKSIDFTSLNNAALDWPAKLHGSSFHLKLPP